MADERLPDDAAVGQAAERQRRAWGGCVYDVDRIIELLEAGEAALGKSWSAIHHAGGFCAVDSSFTHTRKDSDAHSSPSGTDSFRGAAFAAADAAGRRALVADSLVLSEMAGIRRTASCRTPIPGTDRRGDIDPQAQPRSSSTTARCSTWSARKSFGQSLGSFHHDGGHPPPSSTALAQPASSTPAM